MVTQCTNDHACDRGAGPTLRSASNVPSRDVGLVVAQILLASPPNLSRMILALA